MECRKTRARGRRSRSKILLRRCQVYLPWLHTLRRAVQQVHQDLKTKESGQDWSPSVIPFDKLYLIEVRLVGKNVLQPVLCFDADME